MSVYLLMLYGKNLLYGLFRAIQHKELVLYNIE